jgi:hypothetical protein
MRPVWLSNIGAGRFGQTRNFTGLVTTGNASTLGIWSRSPGQTFRIVLFVDPAQQTRVSSLVRKVILTLLIMFSRQWIGAASLGATAERVAVSARYVTTKTNISWNVEWSYPG